MLADFAQPIAVGQLKAVNLREDGPHTPGPRQAAVEWMIRRDVRGFGVETINTDACQSYGGPVAHPCHTPMHGANKFGLQSGKVPGLAFNV